MSSNAFMLPVLPQTPAPGLNREPSNGAAADESSRLGESSDQSKSFSATLNQISDRNHRRSLKLTATDKSAVTSRRSNNEPENPGKMSKTNASTRDDIEESGAPVSGKKTPSNRPWQALGLLPYYLFNVPMSGLHLPGVTGPAGGLNPDTSSSGGLRMAAGMEGAHINGDHLFKMVSSSQLIETGISENAKTVVADHDGRLSFWASGDPNSETLLEAQSRHLSENFQALKNGAALKAAAEQSATPNSANEGFRAKTPEEVFGLKSAVPKNEILPFDGLGNKIGQIDGDSKDSGFSFSQDQMPQHLVRLENTAQSSEGAQRSLMSQTLNQIVQKAVLSLANGHHEVQIDLKPEFLGHIRMQIVTESQQVAVRMVAELPFVKDMLESNLSQLKAELQAQGLEVDELEVSIAHDSRADDDKHQKAAEVLRARASKSSRFSADADAEEKTDMHTGLGDGMAETAIDYFA